VEEQFYVRIRGREQGPYDKEKLRSLVRRGQLSRMHEVSTNKVAWRQAADFPELFAAPDVRSPAGDGEASTATIGAPAAGYDQQTPAQDTKEWYYAKNNVQSGPVSFEHLRALTQAGAVLGEDLVWKEGMSEWKPAWQMQGLHTIPLMTSVDPRRAHTADRIGGDIIRTMSDSKAWSGFVSVCTNVFGWILVTLSVLTFLFGVRKGNVAGTAGGLFGLLWGSIIVTAGIMLLGYNKNVGRFLVANSPESLDAAMRSLKSLWVFMSIILLIIIINVAATAIWAFSAGLVSLN
jgi:hypothetical protein